MKRVFIKRIAIIIISIISIAIFNYKIDSANIFSDNYKKLGKIFSENKNIAFSNLDERLLKKEMIQQMKNPVDILIVGSSTIMFLGEEQIKGQKIFNAGVSGAGIKDDIALTEIYVEKFGFPSKIIIGTDLWLFNKNSSNGKRYKSIEKYYFKFTGNNNVIDKKSNEIKKYKKLLEIDNLKNNIKIFGKEKNKIEPIKDSEIEKNSMNTLVREDATIRYPKKYRNGNGENWQNYIGYNLNNYSELNQENKIEFENYIKKLKENNVEVILFIAPRSPNLEASLHDEKSIYFGIEKMVLDYINNFAEKENIKVVGNFYDESLKQSDFYDGLHIKLEKLTEYLKMKGLDKKL